MNNHCNINIIIDGLGYDIARQCDSFSFMSGGISELDTVLGFSSSAIPTILTGKMPEEHGRWNLFYFNENTDFPLFKHLSFLPKKMLTNRYFRKGLLILNKLFTRFKGYYQAYDFPSKELGNIAICENTNIYSYGGVPHSKTIIDLFNDKKIDHLVYSYKDGKSDSEILSSIVADAKQSNPEQIFVYLCEYDAFGHHNATDTKKMIDEANRYGKEIEEIYNQLNELYGSVSLSICSDHGMVPLTQELDLGEYLQKSGINSDTYRIILDSTMARIYVEDKQTESDLRELLSTLPGTILQSSDLQQYSVNFEGKYGDLLFVVDEGVQITPSHMGKTSVPGMHGYLPDCDAMKAVFMSSETIKDTPDAIWNIFDYWVTQVDTL